jgi:EAL domain-containing protein (putative c-di-GMP-specific phosphodiesterase class I)
MQTIADLRRAIERDQLSLQYQPLVRAGGLEVAGIEALLRWSHPQRGDIQPTEFIPLAEESGLIFEIGEWVLDRACRELVALRGEGFHVDHIAVNLSVAQLRDERFVTRVAEVLRRSGLDPAALALEVTESCAVFDSDNVLRRLNALKSMGVRLVMDDFGTGYSSLAQLRRFPIDRLKLDRLFVHEMDHDPVAVRICDVVTTLAHALGLTVIAEGVETQAQREQLERIGCDLLQGFLLARPLAGPALRAYLRRPAAAVA